MCAREDRFAVYGGLVCFRDKHHGDIRKKGRLCVQKFKYNLVVGACIGLTITACATATGGNIMELPDPQKKGRVSVEEAIENRRSRREYGKSAMTLKQIGQVLWAAQGITGDRGRKRAAPSAGATYPMELYLVVGEGGAEGLGSGIYHYLPDNHELEQTGKEDIQNSLAAAALGQNYVKSAPVDIVMAADYQRTIRRYGKRGRRYVHMEAGHIGENIYLQAEAEGLSTVVIGAFDEEEIAKLLGLRDDLVPLYIMPIGRRK